MAFVGAFHGAAFDTSYAMLVPIGEAAACQRHDADDAGRSPGILSPGALQPRPSRCPPVLGHGRSLGPGPAGAAGANLTERHRAGDADRRGHLLHRRHAGRWCSCYIPSPVRTDHAKGWAAAYAAEPLGGREDQERPVHLAAAAAAVAARHISPLTNLLGGPGRRCWSRCW